MVYERLLDLSPPFPSLKLIINPRTDFKRHLTEVVSVGHLVEGCVGGTLMEDLIQLILRLRVCRGRALSWIAWSIKSKALRLLMVVAVTSKSLVFEGHEVMDSDDPFDVILMTTYLEEVFYKPHLLIFSYVL